MIRAIDIQDKLIHLVGWEQNYDTTNLKISDELTQSETGMYFQQAHPLLTLQNLSCIAPDFKNTVFPKYSEQTQYQKGNIVSDDNDILYKAVKSSKGVVLTESEYWLPTNLFSEWLEKKTRASILKVVSRYINDKLTKGTYKQLFESKALFDGTGRITDVEKNRKNLVGFEIVPIRAKGVTTKINKIGLQFTEPGEYSIYIMHSSSIEPIYQLQLNKTQKNTLEWFDVKDIYLPYTGQNNDAGGSWYICYSQSSLPEGSQAIRKEYDWSKGPCNSCSKREYDAWKIWSKYIEIHPFYVNEEHTQTAFSDTGFEEQSVLMWDVNNNQYVYDTNFGINLDITIGCDISSFIIEQRELFADVIMKQLAVDMLREFAFNANVRTNRHSINASRLDILYEVDGDMSSIKNSGINHQLEQAYKAVELSTEGLDRVCLPCANHGIKYRTI